MIKTMTFSLCFALLGEIAMAQDIEMVIGEHTYTITLNDNDAAKSLVSRLPMTLTFENFGRYERIAYLKPGIDDRQRAAFNRSENRRLHLLHPVGVIWRPLSPISALRTNWSLSAKWIRRRLPP